MTHEPSPRHEANGCNPRAGAQPVVRRWGDIRASTGLPIRDFAERVGINRGQLSKIERGISCPTPAEAHRLLAVLVDRP